MEFDLLLGIQFHTFLAEIQSVRYKKRASKIALPQYYSTIATSGEASFLREALKLEIDLSEVLLALDLTEVLLELFLVPDEAFWPGMLADSGLSSG